MRVSRLAWLGIVRRPAAAVLAVAGIAVAAAAGGTVDQLLAGVQASLDRGDPDVDVVVGPKSGALDLYFGGLHLTEYTPDVMTGERTSVVANLHEDIRPRHAMPIARFAHTNGIPIVGVTPAWRERPAPLRSPRLRAGAWFDGLDEAVVGAGAAARLGVGVGDVLDAEADLATDDGAPIWSGRFRVTGLLEPAGHAFDDAVVVAAGAARDTFTRATELNLLAQRDYETYTHVLVNLDPADARARDELFQIVHVRRAEQVVHVAAVRERLLSYTGVGRTAGVAVAVLLGLMAVGMVGGLLNERAVALRPQLEVLRAQGYRRRDVSGVLLLEGAAVIVAGVALGALLEHLVVPPLLAALPIPVPAAAGLGALLHPGLWSALLLAGLAFSLPALAGLRPAGVRSV